MRLRYSYAIYCGWYLATALSFGAAVLSALAGQWGWTLGWVVGSLATSAHARLERLDGHAHHHHAGVDVP
jgi:hypothetical protein